MKCSGPAKRIRHGPGIPAEYLRNDALDPSLHFGGAPPLNGEENYTARIRARDDQMRNAVGKRVCLAGPCTGDDEKWRRRIKHVAAVFDRAALFGVELVEVCCSHGRPVMPR